MLFDRFDPLKGERLEIMDKDGRVNEELRPDLSDERLKELYVRMSVMRLADKTALNLQREGRMGTYAPVYGQEVSQASSAFLRKEDWLVPSYRESGALFMRGVPLSGIYRYWMGDERGLLGIKDLRVLPVEVVVGSQPLHAVGVSWAMKLQGIKSIAAVYFGDGATSEGSFHEAMNFAGVFNTPTVFICQNNQFAISVPRRLQTKSKTIAQKANAYGFKGIQIYGNDIMAVYAAMKEAMEDAREGRGPRLIEMLTYRFGPHTTADDPTKYRDATQLEKNKPFDPLTRIRLYLSERSLWSEEEEYEIMDAAKAEVEKAVAEAESAPEPEPSDIFQNTWKREHPYLKKQEDELLASLRETAEGGASHA
ncbi:MAG: pyruvate dehydrogenase (acetyl-transferring) E1 component subunit alpha [Nitrospirota bacterium]